jgi:hypothetical protein
LVRTSTLTVRALPCGAATFSSVWDLRFSVMRGGVLALAVGAAQVREQLELGVLADRVLRATDGDPRLLELREQPVDGYLQDVGKL